MKKILFILLITMLGFVSCQRVPAGYSGIKVNLLGSEKGDIEELGTGRYYIGVNEELHLFPTFNQNYVWTKSVDEGSKNDESLSFSVEGMVITVNVGVEYNLMPGKVKDIFVTYRKGVDELTDITIRNVVRDEFNTLSQNYDMNTLIDGGMATLIASVEESTRARFADKGINIISLTLVSAPIYPTAVIAAIESKINATQKAIEIENQLRETEAEAKKEIAKAEGYAQSQVIRATADARANSLRSKTYTSEVLSAMWIQKWDGKLSVTSLGDVPVMIELND